MFSSWAARVGLYSLAFVRPGRIECRDCGRAVEGRRGRYAPRHPGIAPKSRRRPLTWKPSISPARKRASRLQKQLQDIQAQIAERSGQTRAGPASGSASAGQRRQRELQRLSDDLQADVERDRNDVLQRAQANMQFKW